MAHNDEAGGSGGKQFWELSQELEEEPHRYEDAAEDTNLDYTTLVASGMTPLMMAPRMPPLMMAATHRWQPTEEATEGPAPERAWHRQGGIY